MRTSSIEDFEKALYLLDEKLEQSGDARIEIRAIGGFAMMYYGLRENGYTIDIDSLTADYDSPVKQIIREVGDELGLDEDWLNTDCAALQGFLEELAPEIQWQKTEYNLKNIDLKVADIFGLIRSKAKAIHDGGLVPRSTDKKDLLSALRYVGVANVSDLEKNENLGFIQKDYPRCYEYLENIREWV